MIPLCLFFLLVLQRFIPPLAVHIGVLNLTVPRFQALGGTPQPAAKLMPEQPGVIATEKVGEHVFGLAAAALNIDRLENGDNVFEEEFGVVASPCDLSAGGGSSSSSSTP